MTNRLVSLSIVPALALGCLALLAPGDPPTGGARPGAPDVDPPADPGFFIGPIRGLTTQWHAAPAATSIPWGSPLTFHAGARPDATVTWIGAIEIGRDESGSTAICPPMPPGTERVTVEILEGKRRTSYESTLTVVKESAGQIALVGLEVVVPDTLEIDENLPPEQLNPITMEHYFGPSIAAVGEVGPGHYRTSVDRPLSLVLETDPPGFGPLMEWRVNGDVVGMGVAGGPSIDDTGLHAVSVGPPGRELSIAVETYDVTITTDYEPHDDIIPEGVPVLFTAVTDPPGFEHEITWLSSTKYGTATPVLGTGPTFVAQFDDTFGPDGAGGLRQWMGVRADNAALGQDQKVLVGASTDAVGPATFEAAGDLDNDGDDDVVAMIPGSSAVQVFLNQQVIGPPGAWPGFIANAPIDVGADPTGLTLGFFNTDPDLDLAVCRADGTVRIFFNDGAGTGTFVEQPALVGLGALNAITTADVTGEGDDDLAAVGTDAGSGILVIMINDGNGVFDPEPAVPFGQVPLAIDPEDLDNDKCEDLVAADGANNAVLVVFNLDDGSGGFEMPVSVPVGGMPVDVTTGDVDGNGFADVVSADFDDGTVTVVLNVDGMSFADGGTFVVAADTRSVQLAEVDCDDRPDLYVIAEAPGFGDSLFVLFNDGTGDFPTIRIVDLGVDVDGRYVVSADLDNSGRRDSVTANSGPVTGSVTGILNGIICPP